VTGASSGKFQNPARTARGESRATVTLRALETLWFNTGTLCNITCANCYIESSPRNDRLAYLSLQDVRSFLDQITQDGLPTRLIGFTGGEPFMNRNLPGMLEEVLRRGLEALVLTNAMKPMTNARPALLALHAHYRERLTIRVSLDHYTREIHEAERGLLSFDRTLEGIRWLAHNGFRLHIASRKLTSEPEPSLRAGFACLFAAQAVPIDANDPVALMIFPEMDPSRDVPEITEACWGILNKSPDSVMCASARMVVKRRDADHPAVLACTLLPYDPRFELGATLAEAARPVPLNHPYCASFCVLGGGACSR
jgi:uncharacterized Fe-S cluster-containing radical SAM superfamily protein